MNSGTLVPSGSLKSWLGQRMAQYALAGVMVGFAFPVLAAGIKLAELSLPVNALNMLAVQQLDPVLWITDTAPLFLGLLAGIAGRREDLALEANRLLKERETELSAIRTNLEQSVSERTSQLDARNAEMRSIISFARQIADIQDEATLLSTSVQTIRERFEGFDASLFLLDEAGQSALLKASSSAAGRSLLQNGYHVAVGDQSPVGRVARRGKLLISPVRPESLDEIGRTGLNQPSMAEIALPLVVRGKVIGVLDVLSQASLAPTQSEAEMFQLLADQLAASIENARLVAESREIVDQLGTQSAEGTRAAWQQYLKGNTFAYQFTPAGVRPLPAVRLEDQADGFRLPITLRGQAIGSIAVKRSTDERWTPTEKDLMEKLAAQVALALENARLIEETRQRVSQEQAVSDISARFSRSLDVEALLQVAVREFAALPDVAEATVVLKPVGETP